MSIKKDRIAKEEQQSEKESFWQNKKLSSFLDFIQKLVFIIGIPVSLFVYFSNKEKERKDSEYFIYDNTDKKYWEYETIASKFVLLGVSDAPLIDTSLKKYLKPDSLF